MSDDPIRSTTEEAGQRIDPQGVRVRIVRVNEGESDDEAAARAGADRAQTLFVSWRRSDMDVAPIRPIPRAHG